MISELGRQTVRRGQTPQNYISTSASAQLEMLHFNQYDVGSVLRRDSNKDCKPLMRIRRNQWLLIAFI